MHGRAARRAAPPRRPPRPRHRPDQRQAGTQTASPSGAPRRVVRAAPPPPRRRAAAPTLPPTLRAPPARLFGRGRRPAEGNLAGKASKPPDAPPGPLPRDENGSVSLCRAARASTPTRAIGSQEHALSSYLKLHPVLSLESTSYQTLQLVANLVEGTSIPTKELEVVPKPHDDGYLRCELPRLEPSRSPEACTRFAACSRCAGRPTRRSASGRAALATGASACGWRAGATATTPTWPSSAPSSCCRRRRPSSSGRASCRTRNGKCLVCSRYVHHLHLPVRARRPDVQADACIPLQAFGNSLGVEAGENVPTHSSVANDSTATARRRCSSWTSSGPTRRRRAAAWPRCCGARASSLTLALRVRQGPHRPAAHAAAQRGRGGRVAGRRIFASRQGGRGVRPCRRIRSDATNAARARPLDTDEAQPQRLRAGDGNAASATLRTLACAARWRACAGALRQARRAAARACVGVVP